MRTSVRRLLVVGALCAVSTVAAVPADAAAITYRVDMDTSLFVGRRAFVDLEFLSAGQGAQDAVAEFSLLPSNIVMMPGTDVSGDASGSLQDGATLGNGPGSNGLFQEIRFGQTFSFLLTLTMDGIMPAVSAPDVGSSFSLSLMRSPDFFSPWFSSDEQGRLVAFNIGPDGKTTWEGWGPIEVSVVDAAAVPEPATMLLVGSGVLGLVARRRRRQAQA